MNNKNAKPPVATDAQEAAPATFGQKIIDTAMGKQVWFDRKDVLRVLQAVAATPQAQEPWISVDDRMPQEDEVVAVLCEGGDVLTAWATHWHGASREFNCWSFPHPDDGCSNVTHWSPLPAAPKGDAK